MPYSCPRSCWRAQKSLDALAPVGTLLGMSAPPPLDPERELRRLQRDLASQEPAELRLNIADAKRFQLEDVVRIGPDVRLTTTPLR